MRPSHRCSTVTTGASKNVNNAASATGIKTSRPKYKVATMNEVSNTAQMPTNAFADEVLLLSLGAEFVLAVYLPN